MVCVVKIAVAVSSPAGAVAELSNAVEDLTNTRPQLVRLHDLAGPNSTLQLLLNVDGWLLLLELAAAVYGVEIVKEMAKSTWKSFAPKIASTSNSLQSKFASLVAVICSASRSGTTVILGLPTTPEGGRRHVGVEIIDNDPQEVTRIICVLATRALELEEALLTQHFLRAENSDCSVKITVSDEGAIQLWGQVANERGETIPAVVYEVPHAQQLVLQPPSGLDGK